MKELKDYVKQENAWGVLFGQEPLEIDTHEGRQRLADKIDCSLSPENLTCDGELSRSQVQARYRKLMKIREQLLQLDNLIKFYEF